MTLNKREYLALQYEHNCKVGPQWGTAVPAGHYEHLKSAEAKLKAGVPDPFAKKAAEPEYVPTIPEPTTDEEGEYVAKARMWGKMGVPEREIMASLRDLFGEAKAAQIRERAKA